MRITVVTLPGEKTPDVRTETLARAVGRIATENCSVRAAQAGTEHTVEKLLGVLAEGGMPNCRAFTGTQWSEFSNALVAVCPQAADGEGIVRLATLLRHGNAGKLRICLSDLSLRGKLFSRRTTYEIPCAEDLREKLAGRHFILRH